MQRKGQLGAYSNLARGIAESVLGDSPGQTLKGRTDKGSLPAVCARSPWAERGTHILFPQSSSYEDHGSRGPGLVATGRAEPGGVGVRARAGRGFRTSPTAACAAADAA